MTIRTYSERTPWGTEWYAIDDDIYDGAFDSKMNIAGVGPTEADALADLVIGLEALAEKTAKHLSDTERLRLAIAERGRFKADLQPRRRALGRRR